jgi:hypothetical protein
MINKECVPGNNSVVSRVEKVKSCSAFAYLLWLGTWCGARMKKLYRDLDCGLGYVMSWFGLYFEGDMCDNVTSRYLA